MSVVIQVENLSKYYRLGLIGGGTLREDLNRWWAKARGRPDPLLKIGETDHGNRVGGELWALRDVSFQVREGEILGIIGRNGAGKSTLLKILSRITAPTSGQVKIRGRVGSLLEVGTGFHPELTGRENIYLNGAILGMKKFEIDRKLDEIIDFAEMSQFIDTPVKRYSSGMTVRLAFAVAAHLEPEILIIDEVLAVGDQAFQKKCLGKMESIAGHGRTVLFVSHNMQAVQTLCSRCILITQGAITVSGQSEEVINAYLRGGNAQVENQWEDKVGLGNAVARLQGLKIFPMTSELDGDILLSKDDLCIVLEVWLKQPLAALCVGFDLIGGRGEIVFRSYDTDMPFDRFEPLHAGINVLHCMIPRGLLNAGRFFIAPRISIHNQEWILHCEPLVSFTVILTHGVSPFWNSLNAENRPGVVAPLLTWTHNSNRKLL